MARQEVNFLDYVDGEYHLADPADAIGKIVGHIRRVRPNEEILSRST
jgi:LmbE family N-acetylglucosaminyl deacetylase